MPPDEAHVWWASLDQAPETLAAWELTLDETERDRACRFRFARDRDRFIASHGLLREILATALSGAPASIRFAYGPNGKPRLAAHSKLHFNLSHSDSLALVAVAWEREIGVDVERVRALPEMEEIARRVFSQEEQAAWQAAAPAERTPVFFRLWTRHEAIAKCSGAGLAEVEGPVDFRGTVTEVTPAPDFFGAVAVAEGPPVQVVMLRAR
ncbi:MAG TPA: 4'-phosphopantetheinyl transferase superfamily protein [Verrucomicrobiae bacterium]|jgi:4'-phosphopantetheinyl transferase|nr:4'-phosphopantetheinyl transferase superfamily protein [Verrucomicrobiae bacterium]